MKKFAIRSVVTVASTAVLILGGCATVSGPSSQIDSDASMPSASPSTQSDNNFASPQNALERYPELRYNGP
jgi:hypothetical protein